MRKEEHLKPLETLAAETQRYPIEAFVFVQEGLQFTIERIRQQSEGQARHVTGGELCWGLRDYALKRWGLLADAVLCRWNIRSTQDFGRIVFAMVDSGYMSKNDTDRPDDFEGVYDFKTAFDVGLMID